LKIHCNHPVDFGLVPSNQALPSQCRAGAVPCIIPNNLDPYSDSAGNSGYTSQHRPINGRPGMAFNSYGTAMVAGVDNLVVQPSASESDSAYCPVPRQIDPQLRMCSALITQNIGPATHIVNGHFAQIRGLHSQVPIKHALGNNGGYVGQNGTPPQALDGFGTFKSYS